MNIAGEMDSTFLIVHVATFEQMSCNVDYRGY